MKLIYPQSSPILKRLNINKIMVRLEYAILPHTTKKKKEKKKK